MDCSFIEAPETLRRQVAEAMARAAAPEIARRLGRDRGLPWRS
jgi:hypothetical protein